MPEQTQSSEEARRLLRFDRNVIEGLLAGADFPSAPYVRNLLEAHDSLAAALSDEVARREQTEEKNRKLSALIVEQEREYHEGRKAAEGQVRELREVLEQIADSGPNWMESDALNEYGRRLREIARAALARSGEEGQ